MQFHQQRVDVNLVLLLPCFWEPLPLPKAVWPTDRALAPFCGVHSLPFPVWPVFPTSDSLALVPPRVLLHASHPWASDQLQSPVVSH